MREKEKPRDKSGSPAQAGGFGKQSGQCGHTPGVPEQEVSCGMEHDGFDFLVHSIDPDCIRYGRK